MVVGGGRDLGEIERTADDVVSGWGEGPPTVAWINEPRVSSEGTLDGMGSCAPKEVGDGEPWVRIQRGGEVRTGYRGGEDRFKFVDTFRRLRNARFSWICSGGLSTAVLGR